MKKIRKRTPQQAIHLSMTRGRTVVLSASRLTDAQMVELQEAAGSCVDADGEGYYYGGNGGLDGMPYFPTPAWRPGMVDYFYIEYAGIGNPRREWHVRVVP